jgi:voltage-gated potassium channel
MNTQQSIKKIKQAQEKHQFKLLLLAVIITLSAGMFFYHFVEKWKLLDSLYFSVIALATIGFGDFAPATNIGKIFTIIYVFIGIAIIFAFINFITHRGAKRYKARHKNNKNN